MTETHPPYQFNIGKIACTIINEGTRLATTDQLPQAFPGVPMEDMMKAIEETGGEPIYNSLNILMLEVGQEIALVDVGFGIVETEGIGLLFGTLESLGISRDSITLILLSHLHGDHFNGLVDADGNLNFPNARYVCAKDEWKGWMSDKALAAMPEERANGLKAKLLPIKDKLTLVKYDTEIIPGVTAIASKGHSPGHTSFLIESEGEEMIHLVDVLHRTFQMRNPAWSIAFDTDKKKSAKTRREFLEEVAEENMLTMFYHLPFPGLGYVEADGDGFQWIPLDTVEVEDK